MLFTAWSALVLSLISTQLAVAVQDDDFSDSNLSNGSSITVDDVLQRYASVEAKLAQMSPRGVKKMSDDEGEKFFPEYWNFDDVDPFSGLDNESSNVPGPSDIQLLHTARSYPFQPSFPLDDSMGFTRRRSRYLGEFLFPLRRRAFECPTGTFSCTSINRPNSCCGTGSICKLVTDTGSGDVGCCPAGQTCSGTIGSCQKEYTSCPSSLGGGCCIPGYSCVSDGCAYVTTITVTVHSTVFVSTSTMTVSRATSTSTRSTSTSSSTSTDSTGVLVPPARPTSLSTATTSKSSTGTSSLTSSASICPTGFYACSAVYQGGCCRTGRDCDITSCPAISSSTIHSNGQTIVVPVASEATTAASTGRCAHGWFSCADTVGGGCCPTGFVCGSSCTATATASVTGTVTKSQPGSTSQAGRMSGELDLTRMIMVLGISLLAGLVVVGNLELMI